MTSIILFIVIFILLMMIGFVVIGLSLNQVDWGNKTANCIDGWVRLYCRIFHRSSLYDLKLPEHGAIVISNHISGLDPLLLIAASDRPLRFMIAKEEYERFGLQWLFRKAGCIPVVREGRADSAYRETLRCLQNNNIVAIFPHGKIHLDDEPVSLIKPGVSKLAERLQCPVYPVRIEGVTGQGSVFLCLFLPSKVQLTYFKPLDAVIFQKDNMNIIIGELLMGKRIRLENENEKPN